MRQRLGLLVLISLSAFAQAPSRAAVSGSGEDPDAVSRGGLVFAAKCASCHGAAARGLTAATDLLRSTLVRTDRKGEGIRPILSAGHPRQNAAILTGEQINDVIAWLRVQVYGAANRGTYEFADILTGDAKQGEQFFAGAGGCGKCHSTTGDLAGIGDKYDPPVLQSLWLNPRRRKSPRTVTVTPRGGSAVTGRLERLDEFNLVLREADGAPRTFTLNDDDPKVEIHDPLQAHFELYPRITDAQIHNLTAFLASLK